MELVQSDINEALPFANETFDIATIFNVLYHQWVRSEAFALAEAARVLRPGGLLLVTEPGFQVLTREMDDAAMTRRRYHVSDFDPWFDAAGLKTLFTCYFTSFGVPILFVENLMNGMRRKRTNVGAALDRREIPGFVNEVLFSIAMLEGRLINAGIRIPFGTTLLRVGQKAS